MQLDLDKSEIIEIAATKIADEYADMEALGDWVSRMLTERVEKVIGSTIETRVEEALNKALEETLDAEIQPVNIFGEKTGKPKTLRGTLIDRAQDFWSTKVNSSGKPFGDDTWGRREAKTRAEWMLGRIVSEEFASQVKANAVEIAAAFKARMREDAHKMIDRHIDGLIKTKANK